MALGAIDFSDVQDFKPVPAGRYPGQTGPWKLEDSRDGQSKNVVVKYKFEYTDEEGEEKTRTHTQYYNLKPQALWSIKRDLIELGADPASLEGKAVDLEGVLNEIFSEVPKAVWLTLGMTTFTPRGSNESRPSNELTKVELRS